MPSKLNAISTGTPSLKFTAAGDGALEIQNDGNTAITISNTGIATFANPLVNDVPVFEATNSSTQSITSNTFTLINLDTVVYDSHSWYDTVNKRYTPQISGYYFFSAGHSLGGSGITAQIQALYKNGSNQKYLQFNRFTSTNGSIFAGGGAILYMNGTTDYVQSYCYSLGTTININNTGAAVGTYFQGHLLKRA